MPAVPIPRRGLAGLIIAVLLTAGCQRLDETGEAISRADLVNDLASRLSRSSQLTYTAGYRLSEGRSGSITQAPPSTLYGYPGGTLTVRRDAVVECVTDRRPTTCTVDVPPARGSSVSTTVLAPAQRQGMITPPLAVSLLTAAALDPNATIGQTDTTVAGRHATCVAVRQLSNAPTVSFDLCVTTEGVLGSFTGVVDGVSVDLALSQLRDAADRTAFDLPTGARVTDRRPADK